MIFFVSRHKGAREWISTQSYPIDRMVEHLDISKVHRGDTVIGTLPINLIAELCAKGVCYKHLSLSTPEHLRGKTLTSTQLEELGAVVEEYKVIKV